MSDCLLDVHLLEEGKEHVVEPRPPRLRLPELAAQVAAATSSSSPPRSSSTTATATSCCERIADDAALRKSKHPLEYASCGSYFKNPSRELPAARLIEDAGLKGLRGRHART